MNYVALKVGRFSVYADMGQLINGLCMSSRDLSQVVGSCCDRLVPIIMGDSVLTPPGAWVLWHSAISNTSAMVDLPARTGSL